MDSNLLPKKNGPPSRHESARARLSAELFGGFQTIVRKAGTRALLHLPRPSRLAGMAELRAKHGLSQRTFANWWRRFIERGGNPLLRGSGRPKGVSQGSSIQQSVKWFTAQRATLFPEPLGTYSTSEILHQFRKHHAPVSTSKQLRRVLKALGKASRDMEQYSVRNEKKAAGIRPIPDTAMGLSSPLQDDPSAVSLSAWPPFFDFGRQTNPPADYCAERWGWQAFWNEEKITFWKSAIEVRRQNKTLHFRWYAAGHLGFGRVDPPSKLIFAFDKKGAVFSYLANDFAPDKGTRIASSWTEFKRSLRSTRGP